MHFTDTVTIYNHYKVNGSDAYHRTVIKGVQWSHNRVQTTISNGVMTESKVESLTFDFGRSYGNAEYVNPIDFVDESSHLGHWTLNEKDGKDIIVLGVGGDITSTHTIKELKNEFQYFGTVVSVSDNRNRDLLKTIKVVVK